MEGQQDCSFGEKLNLETEKHSSRFGVKLTKILQGIQGSAWEISPKKEESKRLTMENKKKQEGITDVLPLMTCNYNSSSGRYTFWTCMRRKPTIHATALPFFSATKDLGTLNAPGREIL